MMNRRKLCVLVGFWAVAMACGKAQSEEKTLYRKASPYATVVVTEDERGLRILRFGDDPDAQSIVKVGDPDHVEFEYVQAMLVALAMVEQPQRVLIVGLGGGSLPSLLRKHYPRMTIDVVDIDADVLAVAKRYFGFREDALMRVCIEDGRRFIEKCKQPYDIIFLDAYGPANIPYDLATQEFLLAAPAPWGPRGSWRAMSGRSPVTRPRCHAADLPGGIRRSVRHQRQGHRERDLLGPAANGRSIATTWHGGPRGSRRRGSSALTRANS